MQKLCDSNNLKDYIILYTEEFDQCNGTVVGINMGKEDGPIPQSGDYVSEDIKIYIHVAAGKRCDVDPIEQASSVDSSENSQNHLEKHQNLIKNV